MNNILRALQIPINGFSMQGMTELPNLYDYVMACLRAREIPQRVVADESGVPFSTVTKIAQGAVKDPSVHTVQRLADYFAGRGLQPQQSRAA